ncbi:MAG: acyl-CoA/acyl-ACP dehydrogenase [Deltaproteobacteria bacterium]|nr:acyl-CoA/acyl-ACP dehydrogenase [Deltaproteobacteria bacterium]
MSSNDTLERVERIAAGVVAEHAVRLDKEGSFPTEAVRALGEAGLLGLLSSKDVGGMGLGPREAAFVVERVARECASTAMVLCMHYAATAVIEKLGPEPVRRAIAAGEHLSTLAFSEPGSRSQFWAPLGTATLTAAGRVRLDARKSWVTSAHAAQSYVWSSKPLAGAEASTLWLVPNPTAGIRVTDPFDGLGLRANDSSPVVAEDATVGTDAMLGEDGGGFSTMLEIVLPYFNVLSSACSVGLMETATARTAAHASAIGFQHTGTTIADLPTVRAYIARMRTKTDMARTLWLDTIDAMEKGRADAVLRVLETKAAAGETSVEVVDLAMRVCGGAAYRKDVGVERLFRDARASQVMGPTTDVLYDFIGKAVCNMPVF